jgi:hypothetical protein
MNQIVIIGKTGKVKTQKVNSLTLETLYKKCKFQKSDNFEKRHTWKIQDKYFSIYSKDTGRAGHENKYDLAPPVDSKLYFGNMAIIKHEHSKPSNDSFLNTNKEEWEQIYTKLMGGFEDLNSEESEEEEEIPEEYLTKQGYSKESGFIVDDSDSLSNDKDDTEEEEEEFIDETDTDTSDKETDENDDNDEENEEALFGKESDYDEEVVGDEEESDEELIDSEDDNGSDSELSCEEYDY